MEKKHEQSWRLGERHHRKQGLQLRGVPELRLSCQLRMLICEHRLTQRELARQTGVASSTIGNFLRGKAPARLEQVWVLARFFGVEMEWLLFGEPAAEAAGCPGSNVLFSGTVHFHLEKTEGGPSEIWGVIGQKK